MVLACAIFLLTAALAPAAVPDQVSYQGYLTDAGGHAVSGKALTLLAPSGTVTIGQ